MALTPKQRSINLRPRPLPYLESRREYHRERARQLPRLTFTPSPEGSDLMGNKAALEAAAPSANN